MAQLVVKGKNIEVAESLHDYVEKKLGKLEGHLDKITAITVELSAETRRTSTSRQIVEVTMFVNGQILRAEETSADMYAAVDAVVEKLQRIIERNKSKLYRKDDIRKSRRAAARREDAAVESMPADIGEGTDITHTKRFQIKPMSAQEATDQMEMLGHDFHIFVNQDTNNVNVVYKRKNGSYGLLIPEVA